MISAVHAKATLWTFYPDRLRESSVLDDLLDEDVRLTIKDLSGVTDDKTCSICQIEYQANYANIIDGNKISDSGELPIKLSRCDHVFGHNCLRRHNCLRTWASNNTCPLCREPLLYSAEVVPGYVDIDMRDCALVADLDYAGRLMRLLREFERVPGPPRLPLLERRGRRPLAINTGAQQHTATDCAWPPLPEALRIVPPRRGVEANVPVRTPGALSPTPPLLERRGRRPLRVNTDRHVQQRAASADAQPRAPAQSPIRRRERYIPLTLVQAQHRPRHGTSRLEYRLYTWLLVHGVDLPSPLDPNATTSENEELTPRQEQALFEYIQSQGAFHYPRMDPWFQNPHPSSDRDVYEQLRRMGVFWQPCGAWGRTDGSLVFVSRELAARLRGQREEDQIRARETDEPVLGIQQEPPTDTEAQEPTPGLEVWRPAGTQTRLCLFQQVRDRLFGRDSLTRDPRTDRRALPRWLRFRRHRRRV